MANSATVNPSGPRRLEEFSGYKAAAAKLVELQLKQASCKKDMERLELARRQSVSGSPLDQAAAALVSGGAENTMQPPGPSAGDLADRRQELRVLERAVQLQREAIGALAEKYSKTILEAALPEYGAIVRRKLAALRDLATAQQAEQALRDQFAEGGLVNVSGFLRPIGSPAILLGRLDDPNSFVCQALQEAVEYGILDRKDDLLKGTAALEFLQPARPAAKPAPAGAGAGETSAGWGWRS